MARRRRLWIAWLLFGFFVIVVYISPPSDVIHNGRTLRLHREQVLRDDLVTLRSALSQFRRDRGRPPESLDQLVTGNYIRKIPSDPFTRSPATWRVDRDDNGDIIQIRSASDAQSTLYSRYSDW
jgi:general secretion pathway protein G